MKLLNLTPLSAVLKKNSLTYVIFLCALASLLVSFFVVSAQADDSLVEPEHSAALEIDVDQAVVIEEVEKEEEVEVEKEAEKTNDMEEEYVLSESEDPLESVFEELDASMESVATVTEVVLEVEEVEGVEEVESVEEVEEVSEEHVEMVEPSKTESDAVLSQSTKEPSPVLNSRRDCLLPRVKSQFSSVGECISFYYSEI